MTTQQSKIPTQARRILRRRDVEVAIGISRSMIYAKLDPNAKQYDPGFPRPVQLGAKSVGWYSDEIQNWIDTRNRTNAD
jgi:prophage regulatory protein